MLPQNIINDQNKLKLFYNELISISNCSSVNEMLNQICNSANEKINFFWLGSCEYKVAWKLQKLLQDKVKANQLNDIVLFLEHESIYTLGKNADTTNLLPTKPDEIKVIKTDRGGDITYHGPGQLIGYPIIDLKNYNKSITWFMRSLEKSIIQMLRIIDIDSSRKDGLTGVWVDNNKIAALGVRLSRWVSMHGFAINIYPDMALYRGIIPCGISDYGLTSIYKLKNKKFELRYIAELMIISMKKILLESLSIDSKDNNAQV